MSSIVAAWQSGDFDSLAADLTDTVTFSSPVADYHGREKVTHLLRLIAQTLEEIDPTRTWDDGRESVYAFTARVDGHQLEGMVREERTATGELVRATLFLRPYAVLRTAMKRMQGLLEQSPLPEHSA